MSYRKKNLKPIPKEVIELRKFLRAYEKLCSSSNSQVNPWIKQNAKMCIDKREVLTKIILDFSNLKDKPPVLFAIIIAALRQTRYKYIKHIYVWNYPMSYENVAILATYLENPAYTTYTLHLMDCMLISHSIERLSREIPSSKFLTEICLDYNNIGDLGCEYLAQSLEKSIALKCLRLNFCGLTSESGKFLHKMIVTSTLSDLYVRGNNLQCEGVVEMLKTCADQASSEGEKKPILEPTTQEKNPQETKQSYVQKKKGKKKRKRKKKKKIEPVIKIGPWIEKLNIADNGINVHSLEGAITTLNCIRVITSLIMYSVCLKEIDLDGNEIGNLASLVLLEAMENRNARKLPPLKLQSTPKVQMPGLYKPLLKISLGKKPKKLKRKSKKIRKKK